AARLLRVAKENGVATILVGHVTKDGSVAGPRVLEHLVDCVLQFEGDRYRAHRVLRAVKNRFGSTNELGVFEMTGAGLVGVPDPSEVFGRTVDGEPGAAVACALEGTRPILLEIQALVAQTDLAMPRRVATGVDPKRLAMIVAVLGRHARVSLGQADVFVNVAGGVRIEEPGADLAVALAIASAARGAPSRRPRRVRRDRPDRPPAGRRPGGPAARRVREARNRDGPRAVRHTLAGPSAHPPGRDDPGGGRGRARPGGGGRRIGRSQQGFCQSGRQKPWKVGFFKPFSVYWRSFRRRSRSRRRLGDYEQSKGERVLYDVGDKVVYPHHGAGTVVKKEQREVLGQSREYLTIQILHNDMTVNVPSENAEKVGLRKVIDERTVEKVLKALTGVGTTMPKNWNRRFKHNRDKMKTGDIFELAEVVRNLSLRDHEKGLSTGEKQMFVKAKKILASELMYAKALDEAEAGLWLDEVLSTVANGKKKSSKVAAGASA